MSPPATYEVCRDQTCGNWQDVSKLGNICTSCGKPMVAVVAVEYQAVERSAPASPIVGRKVFRSASLRNPGRPCPVLAAADAGKIDCSHPS
jgi:hypothetical protein